MPLCTRQRPINRVPYSAAINPSETLPSQYLPSVLTFISWDAPTIVAPNIDVNYKMTGYDWFNRTLSWSLVSGPGGMTINATTGLITWTPPTDSVTQPVTVRMTPASGTAIDKTFTIQVDSTRCRYVSPTGSDAAAGSLAAPWATSAHALDVTLTANTGFAIYVRNGTIAENFDPVAANYWGCTGPNAANPVFWRNYPGETANITIASGSGPSFYSLTRLIAHGLNISGGTGSEGGCFVGGGNAVFKLCSGSNYNVSGSNNPTGYKVFGGDILDTCKGFSNYDRGGVTPQNWSNFTMFCDSPTADGFIIDCESYDSTCGFKWKHSGPGRFFVHRSVAHDVSNAFDMASDFSATRFSLGLTNSLAGNNSAMNFGNSSGTNSTLGALTDACLLIAESGGNAMDSGQSYFYADSTQPIHARANTLVCIGSANATYPGTNWPFRRQTYGNPLPSTQQPALTNNIIYSPSSTLVERKDSSNITASLTLTQMNSEPNCSGNTHLGAIGSTSLPFQAAGYNWTYTAAGGLVKGAAL